MDLGEQLTLFVKQARSGGLAPGEVLRQVRREFIVQALTDNRGNNSRTALQLGCHRNTLLRVVAELGIDAKAMRGKPVRAVQALVPAERQA